MKRTALYFTSRNQVELIEEDTEPVERGQVLVEAIVSAISAGTELLFLRGEVPPDMGVDESIGSLSGEPLRYPLKYGYAMVGRVSKVGVDVDPGLLGRTVFAFHPHESRFVASPESLILLPDDIPLDKAALLPTMETALSLVMDSRPVVGERVVVVGLGMVGLLTTHLLASMSPGRLVCTDLLKVRRDLALQLGAHAVVDGAMPDYFDSIRAQLSKSPGVDDGADADLAVELSGHPSGLDVAIDAVGFGGRVIVGSWYGTKPSSTRSLGGAFHRQHVEVRSSQVSRLNPRWTGRWTKRRRLATALALLTRLDHTPLITHRLPLARAAEAYAALENDSQSTLQVLIAYEES